VRTLSRRELNRALLARQLLLDRAALPIPRALERVAGLQAQYAPAMYVGLWSRLAGFRRGDLTRALEQRQVVQGTLLRATIHLVSARDYWPFAIAVRRARREWYLRVSRNRDAEAHFAEAARIVRAAAAEGPLRRTQIDELVGRDRRTAVGLWLDLVRVPPSGTWERRSADLFACAEDWLGPPAVTEEDGVTLLVRRYLGGFGPSTPAEIADWAGLPVAQVTAAVERIPVRRFRAEDGTELVDVTRAPLPDPDTPAPVRFLPPWDASLLAHARRSGILPEEHRPKVFNVKTPHSVGTFLVDGSVAGIWRYEEGRVGVTPFDALPASARSEVDEEAERLSQFYA
jgi:winged helix DNA-binding protein